MVRCQAWVIHRPCVRFGDMPERLARQALYEWIGRRLKWAREQMPLTQAELAPILGVSVNSLSNCENGRRCLSLVSLITAANRLRVGTEYLLTGDLVAVESELRERLVQAHPELLRQPGRRRALEDPAQRLAEEAAEQAQLEAAMEVVQRHLSMNRPHRPRRASAAPAPAAAQSPGHSDTDNPKPPADMTPAVGTAMQARTQVE
jgi:transcriptional regulator with XRE-family HTH domain